MSQERTLATLGALSVEMLAGLKDVVMAAPGACLTEASEYPADAMKQPRRVNVVGLDGPRGSGKTTLLVALRKSGTAGLNTQLLERKLSPNCVLHLDEIDGSTLKADVPIGLSLLWRLQERAMRDVREERARAEARRAWSEVTRQYVGCRADYHQIALHYGGCRTSYEAIAAEAAQTRFNQHVTIFRWLETLARLLGRRVFLLPLDDADLMQDGLANDLLWSLLDELHQPRLALVVSADWQRLEEQFRTSPPVRPLAPKPEDGGQTVRDLRIKAIPVDMVVSMERWSPEERRGFQGTGAGKPARTLEACLAEKAPDVQADIMTLLPPFPRGLESVSRFVARKEDVHTTHPWAERLVRLLMAIHAETALETLWPRSEKPAPLVRALIGSPSRPLLPAEWATAAREAREGRPLRGLCADRADVTLRYPANRAAWMGCVAELALKEGPRHLFESVERFSSAMLALSFAQTLPKTFVEKGIGRQADTLPWVLPFLSFSQIATETVVVHVGLGPFWAARWAGEPHAPVDAFEEIGLRIPADALAQSADLLHRGDEFLPSSLRALVLFFDAAHRAQWNRVSPRDVAWPDLASIVLVGLSCALETYLMAAGRPHQTEIDPRSPSRGFAALHKQASAMASARPMGSGLRQAKKPGKAALEARTDAALRESLKALLDAECVQRALEYARVKIANS
ncbi:hypothetical protein L6V77_26475 [Myxococcota bacterium]|nr:hypothetical protein [Myxococcota bacterium]